MYEMKLGLILTVRISVFACLLFTGSLCAGINRSAYFAFEHTIWPTVVYGEVVLSVDLDGDGDLDVISASRDDNIVAWYENTDGSGTFGTQRIIPTSGGQPYSVAAGDLDGDGDVDIAIVAEDDSKIVWHANLDGNGTFGTETLISTAFNAPMSIALADIDDDNDADIVFADLSNKLVWYENLDGFGTFSTERVISDALDGSFCVIVEDVDGDGDLDAISASAYSDEIAWHENLDGAATSWQKNVISVNADGASIVIAADFDGDGDIDVASASIHDRKLAWYANTNGLGVFGPEQFIDASANEIYSMVTSDFDCDGDKDIAWVSYPNGRIAWHENLDGLGSFGLKQTITEVHMSICIDSADIDGDSDPDLAFISSGAGVKWLENRGGQYRVEAMNACPASIETGQISEILEIVVTHLGRSGDSDMELASLAFLLEETAGTPLGNGEANSIIENVFVYLDDGSGGFEVATDTLVTTLSTLALDPNGIQIISFVDNDQNVQIQFGTPRTYFLVVEISGNAHILTPDRFRISHVPESGTVAEDRDFDTALNMEYADVVPSDEVPVLREVSFAALDQSQDEEIVIISVACQLSSISSYDVEMPFSVDAASSATGPDDYFILTDNPLVIPAGSTVEYITIYVANDDLIEGNETVILALGLPTNAAQGATTSHVITIVDNDPESSDGNHSDGGCLPGPHGANPALMLFCILALVFSLATRRNHHEPLITED